MYINISVLSHLIVIIHETFTYAYIQILTKNKMYLRDYNLKYLYIEVIT